MSGPAPLSREEILAHLDQWLEVEFTFLQTDDLARAIARLDRDAQRFLLDWTRRAAATSTNLAFEFARRALEMIGKVDQEVIVNWCLHAMDSYDRSGLNAAMTVIRDLEGFLSLGHRRANGALYEDSVIVLAHFVQGLDGRRLKIERDEVAWTDGEVIYLPEIMAHFDSPEDNFQLYKAHVAQLWAQTRCGTLNEDLASHFAGYADPSRAQALFHRLEVIRLDAFIARELPGLHRTMRRLSEALGDVPLPAGWEAAQKALREPAAAVSDTLHWLARLYPLGEAPAPLCYQGQLRPAEAWAARLERLERDRNWLRQMLRVIADEITEGAPEREPVESFELKEKVDAREDELLPFEIALQDAPIPVPEQVTERLTSVLLDLGEIPPEYLSPAGDGEYDPSLFKEEAQDAADVWSGIYHEEGAYLYNEWDRARQAYKKDWCVLREIEVEAADTAFYEQTLDKYAGHVRSLRRTFEILRGEDKLLKRQRDGDDIDIDALVETWGDVHQGLEMSDRVFTRQHREERNIAVMFMVDMSGSTRGWINEAEREALILLAESLETLGDRYAIYGFSGWTRKRCDAYRVKDFDEPWDETVIGRVCNIEPKDYTRMGAPIRHLVQKLKRVEARTKLLVTLSDGKPDDYDLEYRGDYGIEDTRQALLEARREGVHAYCITIDKEGQDYLPHMYGVANYTVLDDVARLPLKVSDIYRRITS
ncbi:MAG: VWA domain-containing protein [Gammaproteobacteria bacterium]|nr:MAG: VWA domain-containing protein [Gammaproteobacteria bacterium]